MLELNPLSAADHVYSMDPAIDTDDEKFAEAWRHMLETGDASRLPLREGRKPTLWRLRRLSREAYLRVLESPAGARQTVEALAYGLAGVENWSRDGKPVALKWEKGDGGQRLTPDSLDAVFCPQVLPELAARILSLSNLRPLSDSVS